MHRPSSTIQGLNCFISDACKERYCGSALFLTCVYLMHSLRILLLVWANEAWFDVISFPHATIWCSIWKSVSHRLVVMVALLVILSSHHSRLAHYLLSYQHYAATIS